MKRALAIVLSLLMILSSSTAMAASAPPDWIVQSNNSQGNYIGFIRKNVKVPVLLYHHIADEEFSGGNEVSLISPYDFRMHMTAIKVNFTPISLRHYYEFIECNDGSITLPENPIIITFDDGYLSNYEIAFPILKELEIPATIFVVTDTVGATKEEGKVNYPHFTWEQAREMEKSGLIEIHSHTAGHAELTALEEKDMVLELRKSKYMIEKNLNKECDMIAFPFGAYNEAITRASHAAGYKLQAWVDNKKSGEAFEVNLPSEGVDGIVRMTVSGTMGNVNVIEVIRNAMARKNIPLVKGWE